MNKRRYYTFGYLIKQDAKDKYRNSIVSLSAIEVERYSVLTAIDKPPTYILEADLSWVVEDGTKKGCSARATKDDMLDSSIFKNVTDGDLLFDLSHFSDQYEDIIIKELVKIYLFPKIKEAIPDILFLR